MKASTQRNQSSAILKSLLPNSISKSNGFSRKLAVHSSGTIHLIDFDQITYCKADGNYTRIRLQNGEQSMSTTSLKSIEAKMDELEFQRIHQSILVRISGICKINRDSVELADGTELALSRRKRKELLALLD